MQNEMPKPQSTRAGTRQFARAATFRYGNAHMAPAFDSVCAVGTNAGEVAGSPLARDVRIFSSSCTRQGLQLHQTSHQESNWTPFARYRNFVASGPRTSLQQLGNTRMKLSFPDAPSTARAIYSAQTGEPHVQGHPKATQTKTGAQRPPLPMHALCRTAT